MAVKLTRMDNEFSRALAMSIKEQVYISLLRSLLVNDFALFSILQ